MLVGWSGERQRETERDRERERERDRQTDRQTDRQRERECVCVCVCCMSEQRIVQARHWKSWPKWESKRVTLESCVFF
jgi:hypothetical protein